MKRLITIILILSLVPVVAMSDLPDISDLTYEELVQLKDQINLAMWNSSEWQEVLVPAGVWIVGEDIPEGHWSITPTDGKIVWVSYSSDVNSKKRPAGTVYFNHALISVTHSQHNDSYNSIDFEMENSWYFICDGAVVFTPYTGKPDLGFH